MVEFPEATQITPTKEAEFHHIQILTSSVIASCSTVDIVTSDSALVPIATPVMPPPHDSIHSVPILLKYDLSGFLHLAVEGYGKTVIPMLQVVNVSVCN